MTWMVPNLSKVGKEGKKINDGSNKKKQIDMDSDNNDVSSLNNDIYFYCLVDPTSVLALNKEISMVSKQMLMYSICHDCRPADINLRINSYGGVLFDGFAAMDTIRGSQVPINTIIEGCAASAATLMSVVGNVRLMTANSFMLIHQLSSGMWGTYENLVDEKRNCDLLMKTIKDIYAHFTKIPAKELDKILKRDLYFDAKKCLKYHLVDHII